MDRGVSGSERVTILFDAIDSYERIDRTSSSSDNLDIPLTDIAEERPYEGMLDTIIQVASMADNPSSTTDSRHLRLQEIVMDLAKELCEEHPDIAIDPDMLGGMPHIKGIRLSVGSVLSKLYVYGNIEKIKEIYGEDITEHQIKEAIAYAQDFLEAACVPTQP